MFYCILFNFNRFCLFDYEIILNKVLRFEVFFFLLNFSLFCHILDTFELYIIKAVTPKLSNVSIIFK